jgi:2-(1,2-epoxy-1,2-dihydrophenyl)acetyl-CoA isomerase
MSASAGDFDPATIGTTLLHQVRDGVATITLNRPDSANAMTADQREAIIALLAAADADHDVRVVVLRATGRHFCSGADLAGLRAAQGATNRQVGDATRMIGNVQRLIAAILDAAKPVVAIVQGPAAGLGAHIAFACDMVIASEEAYFFEPFLLRGIVVDAGGAYLLPRLIGLQRAKEIAFFGDKVTAADAHRLGLVNRVSPTDQLDETAGSLVGRLATSPTSAVSLVKRMFNRSLDGDRADAFTIEAMAQELQGHSRDATEGVQAFMERRAPEFSGY